MRSAFNGQGPEAYPALGGAVLNVARNTAAWGRGSSGARKACTAVSRVVHAVMLQVRPVWGPSSVGGLHSSVRLLSPSCDVSHPYPASTLSRLHPRSPCLAALQIIRDTLRTTSGGYLAKVG